MRKLEREEEESDYRAWHVSVKSRRKRRDELAICREREREKEGGVTLLLSVIRRASRGNQSRIRIGSWPHVFITRARRAERNERTERRDVPRDEGIDEIESSRKTGA